VGDDAEGLGLLLQDTFFELLGSRYEQVSRIFQTWRIQGDLFHVAVSHLVGHLVLEQWEARVGAAVLELIRGKAPAAERLQVRRHVGLAGQAAAGWPQKVDVLLEIVVVHERRKFQARQAARRMLRAVGIELAATSVGVSAQDEGGVADGDLCGTLVALHGRSGLALDFVEEVERILLCNVVWEEKSVHFGDLYNFFLFITNRSAVCN